MRCKQGRRDRASDAAGTLGGADVPSSSLATARQLRLDRGGPSVETTHQAFVRAFGWRIRSGSAGYMPVRGRAVGRCAMDHHRGGASRWYRALHLGHRLRSLVPRRSSDPVVRRGRHPCATRRQAALPWRRRPARVAAAARPKRQRSLALLRFCDRDRREAHGEVMDFLGPRLSERVAL